VALALAGQALLILDNLRNSRAEVVDRLATICGCRADVWRWQQFAERSLRVKA